MIHEILKILDTTDLQELEKQRITTDLLRLFNVVGQSEQLVCPDCKSKARLQNGFIWCENDDCGGIYRAN